MVKGQTTVHLSGSAHVLNEGDIFISNSQMVHFYENYDNEKIAVCIVMSAKYLRNFRDIYKNALFPSHLTDKRLNLQIYDTIKKWITHKDRSTLVDCAFVDFLLNQIVNLYGVEFADSQNPNNYLAIQFINYVTANYNKDISLETAARHFGYSKEYFSKKFKQTVDKNFLSFLNAYRLQKAVEMLNHNDKKLSFMEICLSCGFNNSTSLYRHLKKAENLLTSKSINKK